jgi:hypothetical protein
VWPAAGGGAGAAGPVGVGEGGQGLVDELGGLVSLEQVADLGAAEPGGRSGDGGVDLLREWSAGRGLERPGGAAGGVVPEGERGVEVGEVDGGAPVEEGVGHGEAHDVGFGSGAHGGGESLAGFGQLGVGVPPGDAGLEPELDLAGSAGGV